MWEAYGLDSDEMLWAGTNFYGGVAGHNEGPCGVVSAMAVILGTRYRQPSADKEKFDQAREEARKKTGELVKSFKDEFGTIVCQDLIGIADYTQEEKFKAFEEGKFNEETLDDLVYRFLRVMFLTGAFENTFRDHSDLLP